MRSAARPPDRRKRLAAWLACAGLLAGCSRGAETPGDGDVRPAPSLAPDSAGAPRLTDWPSAPPVEASERPPQLRILSAAPSVTEICCALGLREQLVGRTRFCVHPPGIEALPSIGALLDTNIESLLAVHPDIVILSGNSRLIAERLGSLPLKQVSVPDASVDDVLTAIRTVGALTGRSRTAERLTRGIQAELAEVSERCGVAGAPRVLLLLDVLATPPAPPSVAGPGSFYADLLKLAGVRNAAPPDSAPFAPLSLEVILSIDPDVIIELDPDGSRRPNGDADALAAWRNVGPLSAVQGGRIRVIKGSRHYVPGPRIAGTLQAICSAISHAQRGHAASHP